MSSPLALSPAANATMRRFGNEGQPLLRVEKALADPGLVVDIAARHTFERHGDFYPGVRAPVSEAISWPLVEPLIGVLEAEFSLSRTPRFHESYLSIVTKMPRDLSPIQRLPHFDGVEAERLAVLLYLDQSESGGTGFYRQRATGYESVDAARFDTYRTELEGAVDAYGMPGPEFISGDTEIFEQTMHVPGTFNSLVVYRGNTLHCAALGADFVPDRAPETGRLTLNLFLS